MNHRSPSTPSSVDHRRTLGPSGFGDDDGTADPMVRDALAAARTGRGEDYLNGVAALGDARLLVPVTAVATAVGTDAAGLAVDKEADMAVVMLRTPDGITAMLAFTGLDSLQRWNADARPVPVTLDHAARAARGEGAEVLLVDLQGPGPLVIERDVLDMLAAGRRLVRLDDGFGWLHTDDGGDAGPPQPTTPR